MRTSDIDTSISFQASHCQEQSISATINLLAGFTSHFVKCSVPAHSRRRFNACPTSADVGHALNRRLGFDVTPLIYAASKLERPLSVSLDGDDRLNGEPIITSYVRDPHTKSSFAIDTKCGNHRPPSTLT